MRTSYEERVPIMAAALRRLGRAATGDELYEELKGDPRFGAERRVKATFRYDQDPKRRRYAQPVFAREGRNRIALRNPAGASSGTAYQSEQSRVYERGQTVVPKRIRDAMGLGEGSTLMWNVEDGVARVVAIPKDPVRALYGIMKDKGPTFEEYLAERHAERQRERELEADEERRWRTYSTRRR